MFIRLFADTSDSALGTAALEYMRSLIQIAPVRVASVSGGLQGRWAHYSPLLVTPMTGDFINCVACDPSRWTWVEQVPMSEKPVDVGELAAGAGPAQAGEVISGRITLYTAKVRNVLFAITPPRSLEQLTTAVCYEEVVTPTEALLETFDSLPWRVRGGRMPVVIPVPVVDHLALQAVVNRSFTT